MAKFVQIIEFRTDQIDEIKKAGHEWHAATEGKRTSQRATIVADRDDPGRYLNIVEFPSYEDAMRNSELPETQDVASKMAKLSKGEPKFSNLELIDELT